MPKHSVPTHNSPTSRFQQHARQGPVISRRTVLFGAAGAAGAVLLVACGDESALLDETLSDSSSAATDTSATTATTATAATDTTATTAAEATADTAESGAAGVDALEMVVDFTYAMTSEGKQVNPYIAVWVEDANGNLVDTVAVWFEQGGKSEWLTDLSAWYSDVNAAGEDYSSVSGATRAAGTYVVSWQGVDGSGIAAGDYFLNIESVREDGPTSLIRQAITVAGAATVALTDDGELSAASIALTA